LDPHPDAQEVTNFTAASGPASYHPSDGLYGSESASESASPAVPFFEHLKTLRRAGELRKSPAMSRPLSEDGGEEGGGESEGADGDKGGSGDEADGESVDGDEDEARNGDGAEEEELAWEVEAHSEGQSVGRMSRFQSDDSGPRNAV